MRFHMDLCFWKKKRNKEGVDFALIDAKPFSSIEILKGKYKGIIYRYGAVSLKESLFDTPPILSFNYTIIDSKNHDADLLKSDVKYHTMMGDILTEILDKTEKEPYESYRNDDIEEFDLQ